MGIEEVPKKKFVNKDAMKHFQAFNRKRENDEFGFDALEKENYQLRFDPIFVQERLQSL